MPFMTRIPSDLARFGLRVEVVPGWETRGSSAFAPACVVDHWTAGPRGTTGRPSLNVVVNGRSELPGPLANIYLARDGTCVVVAAGRANHAGTGGYRGLVGNSAAYGIEAESGGDGDWTPEMLAAYPRLNAALLSGLGRDASWACGHNEWAPTRKIDIRDIIGTVRAQTAAVLANPQEDDMYGPDQRYELVTLGQEVLGNTRSTNGEVARNAIRLERIIAALDASTVDVDELAPKIAALLVGDVVAAVGEAAGGLTDEQAQKALENALAKIRVTIA